MNNTLIMDTLNRLPGLTDTQRAEIFHAIERAPVFLPESRNGYTDDEIDAFFEQYQRDGGDRAWGRASTIRIAPRFTLDDLVFYAECPTQVEILKALDRGARMVEARV